jgi:CheY-like chemotaxis protein
MALVHLEGEPPKVLVVDDDPGSMDTLTRLLSKAGMVAF